jgi:hypothetical protein
MHEHPFVTVAKFGLMVLILLFLIFLFAAHNDTQEKVIATRQITDEVREQVFEMKRMLKSGVSVTTTGGETADPVVAKETGPRIPGFIPLLQTEPDRPRPADHLIDWDAQYRTATLAEPKGFNFYTSDRDRFVSSELSYYIHFPLCERLERNKDEWKAGLVDHVEVSPDRTEFYLWLRKGVYWHRPPVDLTDEKYAWMRGKHEVTTEDLVFSLDMIFNDRADTSSARTELEGIKDYRAVDRYTPSAASCRSRSGSSPTRRTAARSTRRRWARGSPPIGSPRRCAAMAPTGSRSTARTTPSSSSATRTGGDAGPPSRPSAGSWRWWTTSPATTPS